MVIVMRKLPINERRMGTSISFDRSILLRIEDCREKLSRSEFINVCLDEVMTRIENKARVS